LAESRRTNDLLERIAKDLEAKAPPSGNP
jgi:hypothetical protein